MSQTTKELQQKKRIAMMAEGPIGRALFKLSAPAVAGMIVMAIYNIVDTIFVSFLRDTTAIAATGIVFPMFQLIGAVGLTFGMGAASVISRRLGAGDHEGAHRAATTAFYSALAVGIVLSVLGAIFIQPLLRVFGATPDILTEATLYGRVIIGGSVFLVVNMTLNNLLRAEGASGHSSLGQMIGAVLNILLDPIFIFVLDMGIAGAAVATVIAQAASTLFLLSFYLRRKGTLQPVSLKHLHPTLTTYRAIMTLGFPTFVRQILGSLSFAIVNNAAGGFGDGAIAAVSITFRVFMLIFMSMMGLAQGLQPLVGYNYGAEAYDRVHATIRLVIRLAVGFGAVAGLALIVFSRPIMTFFTPQDAEVIAMGTFATRTFSIALIPAGLVILFGGIFQALGDGRSALLLAASQQGLYLIPMVLLLPPFFGVNGVFMAQPAGFVLAFLTGLILMKRSYAKLKREEGARS